MKYTEKLNLPIYDTPETDLFKIQDWNNGNTKIEQAYDEMLSYNGSETLRVQKEQERVLNETNRINNETTRNSSETNRVTSENTRKQNELDRIQREQETSLREQDRITNENNRVSLESERISSESLRVTKEDERIKSETERISKESERQIKEQDRVSSEEVRKTNELARQSVYKEITDARKDFNGVTRDNLEERLSSDLSYVNNRFNNASLLEYEAKYISASKSYDGITKDLKIKGRTLNNIVRHETTVYSKSGSGSGLSVEKTTNGGKWVVLDNKIATYRTIRLNKKDMLKPSTTYTLIFNVAKDDFGVNKIMTLSGNSDSYQGQGVNVLYNGAYVVGRNIVKFTTHSDISAYTGIGFGFPSINISATVGAETIVEDIMLLEGDYTNENIPFFEGIKSVGEEGKFDVVSCGKNLFDKKKQT